MSKKLNKEELYQKLGEFFAKKFEDTSDEELPQKIFETLEASKFKVRIGDTIYSSLYAARVIATTFEYRNSAEILEIPV